MPEGQEGRRLTDYFQQLCFNTNKDSEGMNTKLIAVETPRGNEMEKGSVFVCGDALTLRLTLCTGDLNQACLPVTEKTLFIRLENFLLID